MTAAQTLAFIVLCLNFVHGYMATYGGVSTFHEERRAGVLRAPSILSSNISILSQWTTVAIRGVALGLTLGLFTVDEGHAQSAAPFDRLAGQWSGSGTINLSNGANEPIRCRAGYDVLSEQRKLQLNLRCASDSYNFDLRASANNSAGAVTGTWSESTRNAAGTISGRAEGDHFQVAAKGPSFAASLTLVTRGNRQSVVIKTQNSQATIKGASIALRRR